MAALGLEWARARGRPVVWTPHFMGFGNVLYLLHWVACQREYGNRDVHVLSQPVMQPWRSVFPELDELILARSDVRFTDRRIMPWSEEGRTKLTDDLHRGGVPADPNEPYAAFIRRFLLPGTLRRTEGVRTTKDEVLLVNVRRGDYYSEEEHRRNFGFDIVGYLRVAVPRALDQDGQVSTIRVVSDDIAWCRTHAAFLADLVPTVSYAAPTDGPVANFFELALARRLVMTNSTFSYWAAMVGNAVHGDNHAQIWAPRFFDRSQNDGKSTLVDERWSIVEDIPGGWALKGEPD